MNSKDEIRDKVSKKFKCFYSDSQWTNNRKRAWARLLDELQHGDYYTGSNIERALKVIMKE